MRSPRPLSAEARLVFRSAGPTAPPDELAEIATQVVDWRRTLMMAEREGATPALWRALQNSHTAFPPEAREFLRTRTMLSDFRMQQLSLRLQQTVRAFVDHNVPVMLLKGAAIGAIVDATFRSRPMSDLDLLVQPSNVLRAKEAVLAAGWHITPDERLHRLLEGQHHLPPFLDPSLRGLRLELHTTLLPPNHSFKLDEEWLWSQSVPAAVPFAGASLLPPEISAVHACIHFAWQHQMQFAPWRTFRTLAILTAQPGWSWERFTAVAREARAGSTCYWTLRLAQHLGGQVVPVEVLVSLRPPTVAWLADAIERHVVAIIAEDEGPRSPSEGLSRLLWRAAIRPKWSGHRDPGRTDPDRRWERELGRPGPDGPLERARRHLSQYRDWWRFLTQTLGGR